MINNKSDSKIVKVQLSSEYFKHNIKYKEALSELSTLSANDYHIVLQLIQLYEDRIEKLTHALIYTNRHSCQLQNMLRRWVKVCINNKQQGGNI